MSEPKRITAEEVKKKMDGGEPIFIIDARNSRAWRESEVKITGAHRIHIDDLEGRINELPRDRTIVTYCT